MADLEKLKEVFGETLPEAHIFFATTANTELPSYQAIRKHFNVSSAVPNRFLWKMLLDAYGSGSVEPTGPLAFLANLPADANLSTGDILALSVSVLGGKPPYTYAWTRSGMPITPGSDGFEATITPISGSQGYLITLENSSVTTDNNGSYAVEVTDAESTKITSSECSVAVAPEPLAFATNLPATRELPPGATLRLSITPQGGSMPYTYKWFKGGVEIPGATSTTLEITNVTSANAGSYTAEVTDATTVKITSSACVVTVTSAG